MPETRCVHDFETGQCALCAPRRTETPERRPGPIPARFHGWCAACHEDIWQGEPIAYDEDYDRWVHEVCL